MDILQIPAPGTVKAKRCWKTPSVGSKTSGAGATVQGATRFPKARPRRHPQSLISILSCCKDVPANPVSALLCVHPPCSGAVTALSGLGDICVWKPRWGDERRPDSLRDSGRQSIPTWPWTLTRGLPAPGLTFTNGDKPCHLPPDATTPKAGKARRAINNSSFPEESPRDLGQGAALTQAERFRVRKPPRLSPWVKQPDDRQAERQADRQRERQTVLMSHPSSHASSFSSYESRDSWLRDPRLWEQHEPPQFLASSLVVAPCVPLFLLSPGLSPLTTTRNHVSADVSTDGPSEHLPGVPTCWVFVALGTQIAPSCW